MPAAAIRLATRAAACADEADVVVVVDDEVDDDNNLEGAETLEFYRRLISKYDDFFSLSYARIETK